MSALFGVSVVADTGTGRADTAQLINLLDRLGKGAQERGKDATGVATISPEALKVLRDSKKAEDLFRKDSYIRLVGKINMDELYSVIGHCRFQYNGSADNNSNNQPFTIGGTIATIEGRALNCKEIYKHLLNLPRSSESDSEPLAALFNYYYKVRSFDPELALRKSVLEITGVCNAVLVDNSMPHILMLVRNGQRPLEVRFYEDAGIIVYASNVRSLDEAIEFANIKAEGQEIELPANSLMFIDLDSRQYAVKDLKGNI